MFVAAWQLQSCLLRYFCRSSFPIFEKHFYQLNEHVCRVFSRQNWQCFTRALQILSYYRLNVPNDYLSQVLAVRGDKADKLKTLSLLQSKVTAQRLQTCYLENKTRQVYVCDKNFQYCSMWSQTWQHHMVTFPFTNNFFLTFISLSVLIFLMHY